MAIFEPRTVEGLAACMSDEPYYNLEVSAKVIQLKKTSVKSNNNFQVIFSFKSTNDYCILTCDYDERSWIVSRVKYGMETLIADTMDYNIRANLFYNILIQVRGSYLSIDVNGIAIFTALHLTEGVLLSGLLGVQAKVTNFLVFRPREQSSSVLFDLGNKICCQRLEVKKSGLCS
jgi:hypothetical protein